MKLTSGLLGGTLAAVLLLLTTGCTTLKEAWPGNREPEYKQSRSEPSLEIPPDLSSAGIEDRLVVPSTSYSEYEREAGTRQPRGEQSVLVQPEGIDIKRDGEMRWLVVEAPPEQVWPQVRDFWVQNGFLLTVEDPQLGLLETEWAENRADIPQGPIRSTIGKALDFMYSAATRDKFRVRLEQGREPGTTEVFLSHRGVEEVVTGASPDEQDTTVWKRRPSDPELEAEMLKRLMVHMGVEEERAKQQLAQTQAGEPGAAVVRDNQDRVSLRIEDDYSRAWRRTGIALDRIGFTVEDRNRAEGIYYIRYKDPLKADQQKGILSRLAFWSDDEEAAPQYQIQLLSDGPRTRALVRDVDGQRDNSKTAQRILTLLQEQLK